MLKDVGEALGPWPILQFFFGAIVLLVGAYVVMRGITGRAKTDPYQLEDKRMEWQAYEHLRKIEENTEMIADNQRLMLEKVTQATEQLKALSAAIWNRGV